jgi:hypothetical protein
METIPSQYPEAQQIMVDRKSQMICCICHFEIPMVCIEVHFVLCTLADRCDSKGLTVDQRMLKVARVLDPMLTFFDMPPRTVPPQSSSAASPASHDLRLVQRREGFYGIHAPGITRPCQRGGGAGKRPPTPAP